MATVVIVILSLLLLSCEQLTLMLFHATAEFHTAVPGSLHVELASIRVIFHYFFQLGFFEAHCD